MRSASPDPLLPLVRMLALGNLAGLAALTLVDRGATRMYATPWTWILAAVVATPIISLLVRLLSPTQPIRLPSPAWLALTAAVSLVPVACALASPYRGPSVLAAAFPVSAVAAFLLLYDWLAAEPARERIRLEQFLALGAGLVTVASTVLWLADVVAQEGNLSTVLFFLRNPHPLGHSNYTAGLMLLGLPWLGLAAKRNHGAIRVVAAVVALLALFNLFNSGSRGGLLGLAALGVAGVAAARMGRKKTLLIATGAVALAALLAVANPRIRAMLGPRDPSAAPNLSNVQRSAMLQAGWLMGQDRPLLGWGPGTTPLAYPRYRHALAGGADNVLQLHNLAAQLWAETGAAGVLAGASLGWLVLAGWRRSRVAAATLAGYGVFSLTDYQLDVPIFAAAVAALLALLAKPATTPLPGSVRWGLAGATLACAIIIPVFSGRDRAPSLNVGALVLGREPGTHDHAVALLQESLALNPEQEIAHFNLGWLLVVPTPTAAEDHFREAARLVPDKGGVYFGLGLALLNQGRRDAAARAFALECVNEPLFLASPWWSIPDLASLRDLTRRHYESMLVDIAEPAFGASVVSWSGQQAAKLRQLAPRLGQVSPGPEKNYRRERIGYPVLMRDLDLAVPVDLYDVREDPRFPDSVSFPLPSKGWLPSSRLLKLLDTVR